MAPRARLLVIDETLSAALAPALRDRGRAASSVRELGLQGTGDEELLRGVFARREGAVLVTADDHLPAAQAALLRTLRATVATVRGIEAGVGDPRIDPGEGGAGSGPQAEEARKHEIVHRWAHAMAAQPPRSVRRYSPGGRRPWRPARG